MRVVRVRVPRGTGSKVSQTAFATGVKEVSLRPEKVVQAGGQVRQVDIVEMSVSTPMARRLAGAITGAEYFDPQYCQLAINQARSVIGAAPAWEMSKPFGEPATDLEQELTQFSHVTVGLVLRTILATILLSYGVLENQLLLIIGGLLFLPMLPLILAIAFGTLRHRFDLAARALVAFVSVTFLISATSFVFGALADHPIGFAPDHSFKASTFLSLAVGVAAAFGTIDDAGRREMLGLAAASQLAMLPCWLGLAFGTSAMVEESEMHSRAASIAVNPLVLVLAAALAYAALGYRRRTTARDSSPESLGTPSRATST